MSILGSAEQATTIVGLLVEKLGGVVTLTAKEVNESLTVAGGSLYVSVDPVDSTISLEVFPKGGPNGSRDPSRAHLPGL